MAAVESFFENFVEKQHALLYLIFQEKICQLKIVFVVEDIQVFDNTFISDVSICKAYNLVENRKGITHTSICLLSDDVESFRFSFYMFFFGYITQVLNDVLYANTVKVINLAPTEDSWQDFMFLGSSQDKNSMLRRFLQCL